MWLVPVKDEKVVAVPGGNAIFVDSELTELSNVAIGETSHTAGWLEAEVLIYSVKVHAF